MTLGRLPTPLERTKISLFSAIDDEYLDEASHCCFQPEDVFSHAAFAVENVKLCEILGEFLRQMYRPFLESDSLTATNSTIAGKVPTFDSLVALESRLSDFESSLPPVLRWDDDAMQDQQISRSFLRQKYILYAR